LMSLLNVIFIIIYSCLTSGAVLLRVHADNCLAR
jgi:hypothetical protein